MGPVLQSVVHTGAERREVCLEFGPEDMRLIERQTLPGQIVPDRVVLVWVRQVGEPWQRLTSGRSGSRAEGYTKLRDAPAGARGVRKTREIFKRGSVPEILPWAVYLPGLRNAIEDAENELPHPNVNPRKSGLTK